MSALAGKPVRCSSCAGTSTAGTTTARPQLMDIRGGVDANGNIVAFEYTDVRHPVLHDAAGRAAGAGEHAAFCDRRGRPSTTTISGTQYNIPNRRVIGKTPAARRTTTSSVVRCGRPTARRPLRLRAADRRARLRGEDGSGRVPAPEHRHDDDRTDVGAALARTCSTNAAKARTGSRKVAASNLSNGQRRHRPRHRVRLLLEHADVLRRRHRG